jgi:uncharacterized membrane protein
VVAGCNCRCGRGGVWSRASCGADSTPSPGYSAIFVLVGKDIGDKVLAGLKEFTGKGKVLQTSLAKEQEHELRKVIEGVT